MHEKERKWWDMTTDDKCRKKQTMREKARQIERACMRRRGSNGWDNRCRENKEKGRKQDKQIEKESETDRESVHEKERK